MHDMHDNVTTSTTFFIVRGGLDSNSPTTRTIPNFTDDRILIQLVRRETRSWDDTAVDLRHRLATDVPQNQNQAYKIQVRNVQCDKNIYIQ
jgi:hypothetical protein